jgi:hypothetical protein
MAISQAKARTSGRSLITGEVASQPRPADRHRLTKRTHVAGSAGTPWGYSSPPSASRPLASVSLRIAY